MWELSWSVYDDRAKGSNINSKRKREKREERDTQREAKRI